MPTYHLKKLQKTIFNILIYNTKQWCDKIKEPKTRISKVFMTQKVCVIRQLLTEFGNMTCIYTIGVTIAV